jgi:DNA-directed RNA polymerase specialized sigma24 family protein
MPESIDTSSPHGDACDDDVTFWIEQAANGSPQGQEAVWRTYFEKLSGLARRRLAPNRRRVTDEDDVAASAMMSFYKGLEAGKFSIADRGDLWRLLVTITGRKAIKVARRDSAAKRGGGAVRGESVFLRHGDEAAGGIEAHAVVAITPELELELEENRQNLMNMLKDDSLRDVANMRLEGFSCEEIAEKLGCVPRTITRKLALIKEIWEQRLPG